MTALLLIAVAGLAAQLVDGGLGMGFGATSTTILIALAGLGPAQASAVVHTAELGTTLASGLSHWRFGNVDWRIVLALGGPGAVGAFGGAWGLSQLSTAAARPWTALVLVAIGANLAWRFSRDRRSAVRTGREYRRGFLGGLGLFGGFIDASGGGGWGPVTTATLLSVGRSEPRRVVGTVNTAEFLVTAAAVAGFGLGLWDDLVANAAAVGALLVGGVIAAPIAAWLVTRTNPAALGGVVGTLLVVLNLPAALSLVGVTHPGAIAAVRCCALIVGAGLAWRGMRRSRRRIRVVESTSPDARVARQAA